MQTTPGPHRQNRTHPEFPERGQQEETAPVPSKPKAHGPIAGRSVSRPVGSARINLRTRAINKQPRPEVAPRRDPDNPAAGSARTRRMLEDRLTTAGGPLGNSRPPIGDRSTTARGHLGDRSRIIRQLLSLDDCSTTPRGARTSEGSFLSGEKSSPEKHGHGRAYGNTTPQGSRFSAGRKAEPVTEESGHIEHKWRRHLAIWPGVSR